MLRRPSRGSMGNGRDNGRSSPLGTPGTPNGNGLPSYGGTPNGNGLPSYGRRRIFDNSKEPDYDYDSESEGTDGDYFYGGYQSPAHPQSFKDKQSRLLGEIQLNSVDEVIEAFSKLKEDNRKWERETFSQKGAEREAHARYAALERSNRMLQKERDELRVKHESPERRNEELKIAAREQAWKHQVQLLQQATVREARRAASEKFGPDPNYVEMTIVLPTDPDGTERSFLLEMAPLESMPHSVHLFMEQVSHKLWDNAYFYLNGPHVLQGGPQAEEGAEEATGLDERQLALQPFRELQLAHLAFPEYSIDFPHVPWTVGFTGRPGGPDFYINKVDNTMAHGPGGQYQHDLDEFADPCFAKVVGGFDTLHAMFDQTTYADDSTYAFFLEQPVRIVKAIVKGSLTGLPIEPNPTGTEDVVKPPAGSRKRRRKMIKPHIEHQVEP